MATVLDSHFLALTAIVTLGYQIFFFIITALLKFDKVTDFAGSTNFVIIAVLTLIIKGSWHFRQVVLTSLVVIWGLRLAIFLLMRILQWGEDRRFDEMRSNLGKLAVFWIFQAVWVWTVTLPVTVVNASDRDPSVQAEDIIGWIMWSVGISFEAAADQQKLSFKNSPENRGKWCNVGVWKYSRHPNYFGEIFLWWGIFVASTPILEGAEWLVILGPIFLTLLLLFVSGLPLLEESADKKFGNVAAYRIYKETTSPLIPLPQSVYGNLPLWFKAIFLFEFPFYSRSLPPEGLNWYMSKTSVSRKMKSGRNITYDLCCLDTRILLIWAYVIFNVFRRYFRASYPYTRIWIYIEHDCSRKMKNESNVAFDNANPTKTLHKSINYS